MFWSIIILIILLAILPAGGFSSWTWKEGLRWFYLFSISFLLVILFHPISLWLAKKTNAIDIPDERRVHLKPTPRLGGLSVYLAFTLSIIRNFQFTKEIIGILIGSSIIYILGTIDDIKKLSPNSRLIFQFLSSLIVAISGLKITLTLHYGLWGVILSYVITILWLIGITNAFNFMDGIDGLASSMGFISSMLFLVIIINTQQYPVAFISAALSGACLGFLKFNWKPAKVFLGDGGSTFIGFILGCLAIYGTWANNNPVVALSTPLIILGIPIFDLIYTTISRIKNNQIHNIKEWLEYAGKDHFHHRLINLGFNVEMAVFFILTLNITLGLATLNVVLKNENLETFIMVFQAILIFMLIVVLMLNARNKENNI